MICGIAKNKEKITYRFFFEGLKILLLACELKKYKLENNISDEMFRQMQAYTGIEEES